MGTADLDLDKISDAELKAVVLQLLERVSGLEQENAALREEIARLKGLKGRPQLKPSGMEAQAASRRQTPAPRSKRRRGRKNARLRIDEEQILSLTAPPDSRFKGYEDYVVQDLVLRTHTIRYRRERWVTPEGQTLIAPLPPGVRGHVGPELRRFLLAFYHRGQMTVPRLTAQLHDLGLDISKRQVQRLLTERQEVFLEEAEGVLRSGLAHADWISVDDTGARHQANNGVCTQIGNDHFAWFATTMVKSRLNFLELLQAGPPTYTINAAALDYMRVRGATPGPIEALRSAGPACFHDDTAWTAHAASLGITANTGSAVDPLRIATEGALWGSIDEQGLLADTVILSDGARQFRLGQHAQCWVHAERLIHKLEGFCDWQRQDLQRIRRRVWWLYADLKAYCHDPTPRRRTQLKQRFRRIFRTRTGFVSLDRLLARLLAHEADLLRVLERPDVPLHTNGSENDIRCQVTRRKISAGTRSDNGRDCRDAFLSLMKTCDKLGRSYWHYLGDRLLVPGAPQIPPLPRLVRDAAVTT